MCLEKFHANKCLLPSQTQLRRNSGRRYIFRRVLLAVALRLKYLRLFTF
jgi:hypothetical protein